MILGTAGHVDHGKTALVKALTGVDTDRLAEEKRRGITIDLGFAPLRLDDMLTLGVVDVPGHEAFVRNMVAGATGVDLALVVVAADEGVMPQTREHLNILRLLGVRDGVVALSKADLVEADWLELVREDVRAALQGTPMANAPIVPTSVVSGAGVGTLRAALRDMAGALPVRDASDLFRMPIDRAFTMKGTGTVVTGTVWSGALRRDAHALIQPLGRAVRVRGIESHGASVDAATTGMRAAVALSAIDVGELRRGQVLVADDNWRATTVLLAHVELLPGAQHAVGARHMLRLHLGTADVGVRVSASGGAMRPGERRAARLVLDEPIVARAGDRFVLRGETPMVTIGGGVVDDPAPPGRRARPWVAAAGTPEARLSRHLEEAGARGVEISSLAVRLGVRPDAAARLVDGNGSLGRRRIGARVYDEGAVVAARDRLLSLVEQHHTAAPLEPGAPLQAVRTRLGAAAELTELLVREAIASGELSAEGGLVARRGWAPRLSDRQAKIKAELLSLLESANAEPPGIGELVDRFGPDTVALLRLLERVGLVVPVEADRWFARAAVDRLVASLRAGMRANREYSPAEVRDLLGISRKYLIPFLEYCDRHHITERRSSGRVLMGA